VAGAVVGRAGYPDEVVLAGTEVVGWEVLVGEDVIVDDGPVVIAAVGSKVEFAARINKTVVSPIMESKKRWMKDIALTYAPNAVA